MKTITILNAADVEYFKQQPVGKLFKAVIAGDEHMDASDGYHTFTELYEHRIALYIALTKMIAKCNFQEVWRSNVHSDGSIYEGWFILGINKQLGNQISYHLPIEKWEQTGFAKTLDMAPEFDGHTAKDVIGRLRSI